MLAMSRYIVLYIKLERVLYVCVLRRYEVLQCICIHLTLSNRVQLIVLFSSIDVQKFQNYSVSLFCPYLTWKQKMHQNVHSRICCCLGRAGRLKGICFISEKESWGNLPKKLKISKYLRELTFFLPTKRNYSLLLLFCIICASEWKVPGPKFLANEFSLNW